MKKRTSSMIFLAFLGWLMIGFPGTMAAQGSAPVLVAAGDGGKPGPLLLTRLDVDARIIGMVAETRMTMTFHNPHERVLSGDLHFPLPEGATVSGYALDINGVMVDGVVVEKEKARRVFETLSRQRIDPGIVEWVKGNQFKTRVFPIPANGQRTIMVRYLSELFLQGSAVLYQLPLGFSVKIKEASLRVEVADAGSAPRIRSGSPANFAFKKWQRNFVAEAKLDDGTLPYDLVVELPASEAPAVRVEKTPQGEFFFLAQVVVPHAAADESAPGVAPRKVVIFWDASASRLKSDLQKEIALLKEYFASWRSAVIDVALVVFRNEQEAPLKLKVAHGDASGLLNALAGIVYDGGTAFGCLAPAEGKSKPDLYLLFSDGVGNFGRGEPGRLNAPLYVFSGSGGADHPFLHYLAENNDGRYVNLAQVKTADAARIIGRAPLRFSNCEAEADLVGETYPRSGRAAGKRFLLAGKLLGKDADIALEFRRGHAAGKKVRLRVSRANADEGGLLRTFWAQKKIEELMIFSRRNEKELVETGKAYGLVTPGTSLIVLDNLEQYVEHRIAPPQTLPEMRRQYFERIEQENSQRKRFEKDRLETILRLWSQRLEWWKTDFSKIMEPVKKESNARQPLPMPQSPLEQRQNFSVTPIAHMGGAGDAVIVGEVVMSDGSKIPGATITFKDQRGTQATVVSNEEGRFKFDRVPPGSYVLQVELVGFKTFQYSDLRLLAGETKALTIPLEISSIQEAIMVTAGAPDGEYELDGVEGGVEGGVVGGVLGGVEGASPGEAAPTTGKASEPAIAIQPWNPQTPYMQALKEATANGRYTVYLEQKKEHGSSPGFYLDCADFFFQQKENALGLRILSNIAELELEEPSLLRVLGHRLRQLGFLELSAGVFEEALKLRPEEPQSHRDLALVLAEQKKYERAVELLNHVVMNEWERFEEIELIALDELNNVIAKARAAGMREFNVSPRLVQLMDLDIRIVMTWDSDMTDIDLWVTEPTEEKASYSHNRTSSGGLVSRDFTEGYGPEEYLIRKAKHGTYKIEANYFGSQSNRLIGPVTVQVDVFTDWGRPSEKKKSLTLRLDETKEVVTIGEIEF